MYNCIICILESFKHTRSNRFKIVRGFNHQIYIMVVRVENVIIKHLHSTGFSLNQIGREKKIVESLTTFPGRINECALSL